ncbi:MAG: hypothetical protein NPIRA05_17040 [Nitrospirales bacterium]|nr:MAG: hypothetical protein NPIRA05_17040 [Nitrospirales bacterium]
MLTFEALAPLRLRTRTLGRVSVEPGQRLTWPDEAVQQLLEKIPEKIRVIVEGIELQPGMWIQFHSPLFGDCTAQVEAVEVGQVWIGRHSVLKQPQPVKIPVAWVQGVYRTERPAHT